MRDKPCEYSVEEHSRQMEEQGGKQEVGPEQGSQLAGIERVKGSSVGTRAER